MQNSRIIQVKYPDSIHRDLKEANLSCEIEASKKTDRITPVFYNFNEKNEKSKSLTLRVPFPHDLQLIPQEDEKGVIRRAVLNIEEMGDDSLAAYTKWVKSFDLLTAEVRNAVEEHFLAKEKKSNVVDSQSEEEEESDKEESEVPFKVVSTDLEKKKGLTISLDNSPFQNKIVWKESEIRDGHTIRNGFRNIEIKNYYVFVDKQKRMVYVGPNFILKKAIHEIKEQKIPKRKSTSDSKTADDESTQPLPEDTPKPKKSKDSSSDEKSSKK
jgi:hypothetical protein